MGGGAGGHTDPAGSDATTTDTVLIREEILSKVERWLADDAGSPVLLLTGRPGTGKSALAAQIADRFATTASGRPRVGATSLRPRSAGGDPLARLIVNDLITFAASVDETAVTAAWDVLHSPIIEVSAPVHNDGQIGRLSILSLGHVELDPAIDPADAYQSIVAPTLGRGVDGEPVVVVVDALDEGAAPTSIGAFLARLGAEAVAAPRGLRWVATSRPDERFREGILRGTITEIDLDEDGSDVARFLMRELTLLDILDERRRADAVAACAGNFLVAHYLLEELRRSPSADPAAYTSNGLTEVYERFLAPLASSAATDPSSSQLWLLTLIAAAGPDGIGTDELSAITGRDPLQTQALTARSSPFLVQVEAAHAVYHPSFAEHLLAADRDPAQVGRAREAHYHLARTYIEDGDFWATITGSQRARIPWHLTQAVELTAPGPGRAKFERDTMRLAWHLFHDDGWAASATEVLGPSAPTEPYLRLQARRVLDHIDQVDPDPTAETLATRGLLIDWLDETGPSEDVIDDLQNLVEVRGRVLEHDHEDTLTARSNLASAIAASGDLPTAIAQFQELTEDRTRILGPDARDTLIARGNLALWLGRAGKTSEAIHQFRQLLAAYGALQDANISDALTARANLASLLGRTGHTHDAIDQLTELLDDHGKAFGPDHPGSFAIRNNLASCVDATGDHERSAELLSALEADTRRTLGSDHPLALTARSNLAEALGRSGQLDAAVRMFRSLGSDRARVLGPNHPDTLATSEDLAWWQDALDQRSSGDLAP